MLLWDMTYGEGARDWKRRAPAYAAALLAIAVFFLTRPAQLTMVVPLVDNAEISADFLTARLTALRVIVQYLGLLLFPLRLSSDYAYNQVPLARPTDPLAWIAPLLIGALVAAAVLRRRRDPVLFFAAGWFGIALLPVSNLVVIIGAIKAERFLYLPAIGFAIAAAVLLERVAARHAAIVGIALLAIFGLRTAARNPDWKDDPTIWKSNLAGAPMSYKVHKNIASALNFRDARGTVDEVGRHLEIAHGIVAGLPLVDQPQNLLLDLGVNYRVRADRAGGVGSDAGRALYARSLEFLEKARESGRLRRARDGGWTDYPQLFINLGIVYEALGRPEDALAAYRAGRPFEPRNAYLYDAVSRLLSERGDVQQALVNVLEQWMAGAGDAGAMERLRALYALTPGGECAFTASGMNPACPKLRADVCAAGAATVRVFLDARAPEEANKVRALLAGTYACPK